MKKLLIIICLLPMAGLAQYTIIKQVSLPKLPVDSVTRLRTLMVSNPVPGAKKDKLLVLLNKWMRSNYTASANAGAASAGDEITINAEGNFTGQCAVERPQYDVNSSDRVATNKTPVPYKVRFTIKVVVADEKYTIVVNNFILEYFNVFTPFEQFYNGTSQPILIPEEQRGMDIGQFYIRLFDGIKLSLQDIDKSASKYIAKAKKRGDL
jgi:hypothetical protein